MSPVAKQQIAMGEEEEVEESRSATVAEGEGVNQRTPEPVGRAAAEKLAATHDFLVE